MTSSTTCSQKILRSVSSFTLPSLPADDGPGAPAPCKYSARQSCEHAFSDAPHLCPFLVPINLSFQLTRAAWGMANISELTCHVSSQSSLTCDRYSIACDFRSGLLEESTLAAIRTAWGMFVKWGDWREVMAEAECQVMGSGALSSVDPTKNFGSRGGT